MVSLKITRKNTTNKQRTLISTKSTTSSSRVIINQSLTCLRHAQRPRPSVKNIYYYWWSFKYSSFKRTDFR